MSEEPLPPATALTRARSMAEMGQLIGRVFVGAEIADGIASFRPRPSDIVLSPFAKCGTTWLQQVFHTLRTRGDMDFDDISRVVPWIETARACELDLEAPQRAEPRGFKSHLPWERVPKGAKYVVMFRDPKDAMLSGYRFMEGWFLEAGAVSLDEFVTSTIAFARPGSGYFHHAVSWWEQRDNPNVLLLSYEAMSADPARSIRHLAAFCGIALDQELLELTLARSSLAFMLTHQHRYDDLLMRNVLERRCGITGSQAAKVRQGKVGGHRREMSAELGAKIDAAWAALVEPTTHLASYAELEAALRDRAPLSRA